MGWVVVVEVLGVGGEGQGVSSVAFISSNRKINLKAQCVRFTGLQRSVMKMKIHVLVSSYI